MGLFKKGKKEEHHTSTQKDNEKIVGGFLGFALLSLPEWDKEQYIADFKELGALILWRTITTIPKTKTSLSSQASTE